MAAYAVTVVGHDAPGVIASVTSVLADLGGNLEDSSMTLLRGHFAMTLVVSVERSAADLREALEPVTGERGLEVTVFDIRDEPPGLPYAGHHVLTVHGADRPGIVSAVTGCVAARGGNVTDLTTRLAGELYVLVAEVDLPAGVDGEALAGELAETAAALGVAASLRPGDDDLL